MNAPNQRLRILADKTPANEHRGRSNAPTVSEIAVIISGDNVGKSDIIVINTGQLKKISELNPTYAPIPFWDCGDYLELELRLRCGSRTAHSTFKLPLDLTREESPICHIPKQSGTAKLLRQCKVIVWDECTKAHKKAFETLETTLRGLRDIDQIMGGVCVILTGDFRQTLPVIQRGSAVNEIKACFKMSKLWRRVHKLKLTKTWESWQAATL